MIVLRALQGFAGGVLIPLAFTIIMTMLPRAKQPIGLALFALSATFAPAIGPDHRRLPQRELRLGIHLLCEPGAGRPDDRHAVVLARAGADAALAC